MTTCTNDILDRLRSFHAEGYSDAIIGLRLGVSKDLARKWRRGLGLPAHSRCSAKTKELARSVCKRVHRRRKAREQQATERLRQIERHESQSSNDLHRVYSDDATEFLRAVSAFRSAHGRVPTLSEAFAICHALGWRKES